MYLFDQVKLSGREMGDTTEYARYLDVRNRELQVPGDYLRKRLENRSVLVTGATGCVGDALLSQLSRFDPAALIGVGLEEPARRRADIEYVFMDIRESSQLRRLFRRSRPDIVFHLAAQRDPGLAEKAVVATVTTNVLGTANVIQHAVDVGVEDLVYASTGKAMRLYTRDVYAASKKIAEWMVARAGSEDRLAVTSARFTHVVDNSIVLEKFRALCRAGAALPLHSPKAAFYVQSAIESAQLLMTSLLIGRHDRQTICAINDLGWPFEVIDIANGVIREVGNRVDIAVVGEEDGYEQGVYPGVFDRQVSGDISPLINAVEARGVLDVDYFGVDAVRVRVPNGEAEQKIFQNLMTSCSHPASPEAVRNCVDELLRQLLSATLAATPDQIIARMMKFLPAPEGMSSRHSHALIGEMVRQRASAFI
ncbi:polysaccharide biosynthesis protein [Nocardia asiatica]|uniref:polysaccharide biosynthesis protein n=1 Tax=Nocardia asiatica TaxID=209252 RepID=UPI0024554C10|nr:polysaccharide biosynthesis protein [Nocardia asiatica]